MPQLPPIFFLALELACPQSTYSGARISRDSRFSVSIDLFFKTMLANLTTVQPALRSSSFLSGDFCGISVGTPRIRQPIQRADTYRGVSRANHGQAINRGGPRKARRLEARKRSECRYEVGPIASSGCRFPHSLPDIPCDHVGMSIHRINSMRIMRLIGIWQNTDCAMTVKK